MLPKSRAIKRSARKAGLFASVVCVFLSGCTGGGLWPSGGDKSEGGGFTILLYTISGPDHVQRMETFKAGAQQHTGWTDLRVVHADNYSVLYWGKYSSASAAEKDLKTAKGYKAPNGEQVFGAAIAVPVETPDLGPPEWNLLNAKGAYTVLIAVFYDVPEQNYVGREKFAVETVRQLRQQGYEAYYYHGPARSHVCVGAFPVTAVQMVSEGSSLRPVVKDARIDSILRQFPNLAVNGMGVRAVAAYEVDPVTKALVIDPVTKQPKRVVTDQKSFVTEIPGRVQQPSGHVPVKAPGDDFGVPLP